MSNMLSNFNPFNEISRFEPLRNLDEFLSNYRLASPWNNLETEPRIKIDVSETDEAYFIKADAPGVAKEDIKVTVEGNLVTIEFEIKKEAEEKVYGKPIRNERYHGIQSRSFALAQDVNSALSSATYHDGVLELRLPKKTGSTRTQLTIN